MKYIPLTWLLLAALLTAVIARADVYQPSPKNLPPGCYTTDEPLHCYEIPPGAGEVIIPNRTTDNVKWYGGIMGGLLNQYFQLEWDVFNAESKTEVFRQRNRKLRKRLAIIERRK